VSKSHPVKDSNTTVYHSSSGIELPFKEQSPIRIIHEQGDDPPCAIGLSALAHIRQRHATGKPDTSGLKPFEIPVFEEKPDKHPVYSSLSSILNTNRHLPADMRRPGNLLPLTQLIGL